MIKNWTKERKIQYESLILLIEKVEHLDNTTNAISQLQSAIATAKELRENAYDNHNPSFMRFLQDELLK